MTAVVSLREYTLRKSDVLVLVDTIENVDDTLIHSEPPLDQALASCRLALHHSRSRGAPVAFVRRRCDRGQALWDWQAGFRPRRDEMLFERQAHSCYASEPFAAMVDAAGGRFVLAGFFGETSCVTTVIDAVNRGHRVTFLADASSSRGQAGFSPTDMHRAVVSIVGLHGAVVTTRQWVNPCQVAWGEDSDG